MAGLLVIMGSGETAPTMVKPHRSIFERVGERPAVLLDTPYGFQSNADDISARAVGYFGASVGTKVGVVSWRTVPPPGLERERALAELRAAGWVFAGPGSPTYTLRQWLSTPIPAALVDVLSRDGVLVFASAAALTLGSHAVPVYEIYKAGFDPHWVDGLNLVEKVTGLPAVIIPHYDNAEGGHHDTRFSYLGENRLSTMEAVLPPEAFVLGVDEHTAVLLDLGARMATVIGNGTMTIRRRGHSVVHRAGSVLDFDVLASGRTSEPGAAGERGKGSEPGAAGERGTGSEPGAASERGTGSESGATGERGTSSESGAAGERGSGSAAPVAVAASLRAAADEISARFDSALANRDVDGCVAAILDLEQTLVDWSADTLTSDEGDHARARLRTMVLRLGELATMGVRDPREVIGGFVGDLLELRRRARDARDFATSDWVRDRLAAAGVEVRDTSDGVQWQLADDPA